MKKLITSAIAATALLFGFASCSNDLHDVENTPYTNSANAIYVVGGIEKSTMESAVESTKATFDKTSSYKVALDTSGKANFTFTYSGDDSWSAGSGATAFAVVADVSNGWTSANGATRWYTSSDGVAVGSEATLKNNTSTENVKITGLSAGTQYTVEMALTAAGGTIKVTEGLSAVPFELIAIDSNGKLTTATSITAKSATTFTYEVTPAEKEQTLKYIARYGNTYFVPTASGSFTVDGATQDAAATTTLPDSVANPLTVTIPTETVAEDDNVSSYTLTFTLDAKIATATKLTASVEKNYVVPYKFTYLNGSYGNVAINWDTTSKSYGSGSHDGKPYVNKKVYTGTATYKSGSKETWWSANVQFAVCPGDGDWSAKYTGATLEKSDTFYTLKLGDDNNNKISDTSFTSLTNELQDNSTTQYKNQLDKDVTITITYTVYEVTFSKGAYSDVAEFAASYTVGD